MVYIALCALILGIIFGQFVLDSTWHDLCSELADYVLYLLMFSVGISVGMNESIIEKIKNYNLTILLIPIGVIIGSVFGGFICSYIFDMNLVYSLSIGASMGWYSLSGVMLESLANAQIGTIAFLSSLMREFIAFMMIPVLVKYLNTFAAIGAAGATSEDSTLPMLIKYSSEEFIMDKVQVLIDLYKGDLMFSTGVTPYLTLKLQSKEDSDILNDVLKLLKIVKG